MKDVAARYARFAELEAKGSSTLYGRLALGIAQNEQLLSYLLTLPKEKQQPNLFLAAVRHVAGLQTNIDDSEKAVLARKSLFAR